MKMNEMHKLVEAANSIAISGHVRPDGDCAGSCLGLYNYLKDCYPEKEIQVYLEPISKSFQFLKGTESIKAANDDLEKVYDLFISLDCGSIDRLGDAEKIFLNAKKNLVIDHHISNTKFGMTNIVEGTTSSTSEILFTLMDVDKISKETAEALYLGIVHDTGVFKYNSTSRRTMEIGGILMEKGIDYTWIIDSTFYQNTYLQNQLLGRCLLESFMLLDGKVIASCIGQKIFDFYEAKPDDLSGVVERLRTTEGVEVAILAYETSNNEYKVSMRSNGIVDVSKIAVYFGGGGHRLAAGCTMRGSYHDVINNLTGHVENQLQQN